MSPRRSRIRGKPGPRRRVRTRVIDGYVYVFDRSYSTLEGAQRRIKGTGRKFVKVAPAVWDTWSPTGKRRK